MTTTNKQIDELDHREIRNLRDYSHIWGESCPTNELPYLIVFRGNDFEASLATHTEKARIEEAELWNSKIQSILGTHSLRHASTFTKRNITNAQKDIDDFIRDRLAQLSTNKGNHNG